MENQEADYIPNGYYRDASGMLREGKEQSQENALTDAQLASLHAMTHDDLIALVRRVAGATGSLEAALMTEDEAFDAVCLKYLASGLKEKDIWKALPALKEWADRRKGKPAQTVAMTVEERPLAKLDTDKLIRLASMLDDPVIISPLPK